MTTRVVGPGKGWDWLMRAVNLGRNNPKAIFGAVAWVALVALIPTIIQLFLQYVFKASPSAIMSVIGVTTLFSILLYPLLIGGLLRVIDAAENGRPTRAGAVFDAFRGGGGAGRLIGFGLFMAAIYIGLFLLIITFFGHDFMQWYWKLITATQTNPAAAAEVAELPHGFGLVMALGSLVGIFMGGVYALGFGQVALGGQSVGKAMSDGFSGTLKNVLPILVLVLLAFLAYIVLVIAVLIIFLIIGIISVISKVLGAILAVPVVIAMVVALYAVMFGVMYYMWRDICGDATSVPTSPADQLQA